MCLRVAVLLAVVALSTLPTSADSGRGVPPYGVVQFGFGSMSDPEGREFMLRCHVNLCESAVYHGVSECWGWGDREKMEERWAGAREQVEELHKLGVKTVSYVAYHPFYGNPEERSGIFDFYDKHWDQFEDYLGPRPPDPMEWTKRDAEGKPMPFQYGDSKGYYICPNNPHWLQYLDGVLHMIADAGLDGARYDGPIDPCHCQWCAQAFGKWLRERYNAEELAEHFGVKGEGPVPAPKDTNDPLMFPWRHYCMFRQGETVAETGAAVRRYNPDFIMSYNYCIWSAYLPGSSRNEYLAQASDYGLIEGNFDATAHSENGRKHSASADLKYLLASSDGKPVDMHYYMYPLGRMRREELARLPQQEVEGLANFWRAAMAEGMAGGCPYPIMVSRAHHNVRQQVIACSDFFYRMRPYLTDAQTYANVAILASISQTCASLPSYPLSVSRYLADQHIPHKMVLERDLTAEGLAGYDALILPEARLLSDDQVGLLKEWVAGGRGLVMFGPVATRDQYNGEREASAFADVLGLEGGQLPEEPIRAEHGAGRLAWFPTPKLPTTGRWPLSGEALDSLGDLESGLRWAAGRGFSGRLDAPDMVELNLMRSADGGALLCHLVNYNLEVPDRVQAYKELALEMALPEGASPQRVVLFSPDLPRERQELAFEVVERDGQRVAWVLVPEIQIYDLVAVELAGERAGPPADARPPVELLVTGPSLAAPSGKATLTATLRNRSDEALRDCAITMKPPEGWADAFEQLTAAVDVAPRLVAPGELTERALVLAIPADAKLEAPCDVEFTAAYTLAGEKRTEQAKHRLLVLQPINLELSVVEQVNPLTRELGLKLSATSVADAEVNARATLVMPGGWRVKGYVAGLTVPARGTAERAFVVVLPQKAAKSYELSAIASYGFAGRAYEVRATHHFELKGSLLVAECGWAAEAPKLDGKLDDRCWKTAARLADFVRIDGSRAATDQTEGMIVRDDANLYVGVRCHEELLEELVANFTGDGDAVWEDDSIEVWVDVGHQHKSGIQLVANCVGAKFSRPAGLEWQAAAGRETNAWTLEIAIPWASLGRAPQTGELWGFNLCRSRQAKGLAQREYSAWSCTYGGFASVERFGHVLFPAGE